MIGYGLEHAYRMPLRSLLQRSIFGPLGIAETTFLPDAGMRLRLVTPYNRFGRVQPYHDGSAEAAYGLYSTPRDMARFLAWHFDERDPVVARSHALIRSGTTEGQALIWNAGLDGRNRILWHGDGTFGQTSQMVLYPDRHSKAR